MLCLTLIVLLLKFKICMQIISHKLMNTKTLNMLKRSNQYGGVEHEFCTYI